MENPACWAAYAATERGGSQRTFDWLRARGELAVPKHQTWCACDVRVQGSNVRKHRKRSMLT